MAVRTTAELTTAHGAVAEIIRMIPDAALDWQSGGEEWTLKSIISHLAHANDFYVMIVDEVRASHFGSVRLHPELAGFHHMEATDAAVAQCRTVAAALTCFEGTYQRLLAVLQSIPPMELDQPFVVSYAWEPDVAPVTTTLRERVMRTSARHLREHQVQLVDTRARWRAVHKEAPVPAPPPA